MLRRLTVLLLMSGACLAAMAGCGPSRAEQEQVLQVLRLRSQALNRRDLPLYLSAISLNYRDRTRDFDALRGGLETAFSTYDSVSYQAGEQKLEINGNQAEVAGSYRMKVVIRGRDMVLDGKEHIRLARETGGWKIISGL